MSSASVCFVLVGLALLVLYLMLCDSNCSCRRRDEGFCVCSGRNGNPTSCSGTSSCAYDKGMTESVDFNKTLRTGWLPAGVLP